MVSRKILILTQHFYPENFRINDVALYLKDQGHDVTVLTNAPDYPHPDHYKNISKTDLNSWQDIKIHRVPIVSRGSGSFLRLAFNYLSFVISASFYGLRIAHKYDLCLVWASSPITVCLPAVLFKKFKKLPYTVWIQDLWPETLEAIGVTKSPFWLNKVGKLVRVIYKNAHQLFIQSEGFYSNVQRWGGNLSYTHYVPNWADNLENQHTSHLLPDCFNTSNFKILYAGNIGKAQNLDIIISAAEKLRNQPVSWFLMGEGSEKKRLQKEVQKKELTQTVFFIDRQPTKHLSLYFEKVDTLCVTLSKSPIFSLTIPSKVQTYMSARKPILAAIDGVTQELINQCPCGIAGPSEDLESLVQNVKVMQGLTEKERSTLGKNALQYYQSHFSKDQILQKIQTLLGDIKK